MIRTIKYGRAVKGSTVWEQEPQSKRRPLEPTLKGGGSEVSEEEVRALSYGGSNIERKEVSAKEAYSFSLRSRTV